MLKTIALFISKPKSSPAAPPESMREFKLNTNSIPRDDIKFPTMKNDTGDKMRDMLHIISVIISLLARNYCILKMELHSLEQKKKGGKKERRKLCDCVHIAHSRQSTIQTMHCTHTHTFAACVTYTLCMWLYAKHDYLFELIYVVLFTPM